MRFPSLFPPLQPSTRCAWRRFCGGRHLCPATLSGLGRERPLPDAELDQSRVPNQEYSRLSVVHFFTSLISRVIGNVRDESNLVMLI